MIGSRAYLDYNASAPLLAAARSAMLDALEFTANPSSVHREGRAARRLLDESRREVAALVNAKAEQVTFTSGATEAASMLLTPDWRKGREPLVLSRLFVLATDHLCFLNGGSFPLGKVARITVDREGIVDLEALAERLAAHDRAEGLALVSVNIANNETGVIQPFRRIGAIVKDAGGIAVFDGVQAAGRIPLDIVDAGADFLVLSSHKIGGPKGAGAIVAASDAFMPKALITGGGQEKGFRAGTENVAAIAGFGAAAKQMLADLGKMDAIRWRRDEIERIVLSLAPDAEILGGSAERLPNTTFFAIAGVKAETLQIAFDLAGVAVSAGSACSSGKVGPSHVVKAMGRGDDVGAVRVSIGSGTTDADIALFERALKQIVARRAEKRIAA